MCASGRARASCARARRNRRSPRTKTPFFSSASSRRPRRSTRGSPGARSGTWRSPSEGSSRNVPPSAAAPKEASAAATARTAAMCARARGAHQNAELLDGDELPPPHKSENTNRGENARDTCAAASISLTYSSARRSSARRSFSERARQPLSRVFPCTRAFKSFKSSVSDRSYDRSYDERSVVPEVFVPETA